MSSLHLTDLARSLDEAIHQRMARAVRWSERMAGLKAATPLRQLLTALDFLLRGLFYLYRNHRYLTARKLLNIAAIHVQFRLKTERVIGMPISMKIEPTNICNTQCQLCPTGIGLEGRPKGKMDFDAYARLVEQVKGTLLALDLSMWGDPLIVPDIYRMIRYAHDRRIWTYISSNLHAFKVGPRRDGTEQAEELVKSGLNLLTCSLHGASQETYEIYQPGKNFGDSVAKIRHIIATRNRLGSRTPVVQLNFVVTRFNEHEKPAFRRLAEELGCRAIFSTPALNTRFLGQDKHLVSLSLGGEELKKKTQDHLRHWLPQDKEHILPAYRDMLEGKYDGASFNGRKVHDCSWPWKQSVINWDGQVVTCCGVFDPAHDFGSVFDRPFKELWNGERYRMARRSFKRKLDEKQSAGNPCADCPGFMV